MSTVCYNSAQEVFDIVYKHLLTQNAKAIVTKEDGDYDCLYRGPNNTKCAVGCLIPDDVYKTSFEGTPIYSLYKDINYLFGFYAKGMLDNLQDIHDKLDVSAWKPALYDYAAKHDLTIPAMDN